MRHQKWQKYKPYDTAKRISITMMINNAELVESFFFPILKAPLVFICLDLISALCQSGTLNGNAAIGINDVWFRKWTRNTIAITTWWDLNRWKLVCRFSSVQMATRLEKGKLANSFVFFTLLLTSILSTET